MPAELPAYAGSVDSEPDWASAVCGGRPRSAPSGLPTESAVGAVRTRVTCGARGLKGPLRLEAAVAPRPARCGSVWCPSGVRPAEARADTRRQFSGSWPRNLVPRLAGHLLLVVAAALLARHNIRQGRSDTQGRRPAWPEPMRPWALRVSRRGPPTPPTSSTSRARTSRCSCSTATVICALFYGDRGRCIRRLWPGTLVAWGRALDGQWRDPMVGRHILLGAIAGIGFSALSSLPTLASATLGLRGTAPSPSQGIWY